VFPGEAEQRDIIEAARAVPPRPPRLDEPFPVWQQDPSESLLGPWVDPRDIDDAMLRLGDVDALLEVRRLFLGLAYVSIKDHELWKAVGCKSLAELCRRFDIDQRTFERYAKEGRNHMLWPEARAAVEAGLSIDRSVFAMNRVVGTDPPLARSGETPVPGRARARGGARGRTRLQPARRIRAGDRQSAGRRSRSARERGHCACE
jgi:hypothetical protein